MLAILMETLGISICQSTVLQFRGMHFQEHFRMLVRYSRIANERVYAKCAELTDGEYRKVNADSLVVAPPPLHLHRITNP